MKSINKGDICDPWNNGKYESMKTNKNKFYKKPWEYVKSEYVSLVFDLTDYPRDHVDFINNALVELGLRNLHGQPELAVASESAKKPVPKGP